MQSAPGTRINLMPPPPVRQAPPSPLEQAQALDRPAEGGMGSARTLSIREEPPYSDASVAAAKNRMAFEAIQRFNAGDRSPEVLAAAIGSTAGLGRGLGREMTANQAARNTLEAQKIEMARQKLNAPKVEPPSRTNPAVVNRHKSLIAEEMAAKQSDDLRKANSARYAREAFEQEHPELGLVSRAPTTTATTPSVVMDPAVLSRVSTATPPKITSKAQFDNLPSGTVYIGSDGKKYKKP